jgi:hypothetical protein
MHIMSNLNKFKDSYQVFGKNPTKTLSYEKKKFKDSFKDCLNNFFLAWRIFTTNTLCVNVYKMYECDENHYNVKNFKKLSF